MQLVDESGEINDQNKRSTSRARGFSELLQCFEKILKAAGESAVVHKNLALRYMSTGSFEDADLMLDH